MSATTLAAGLAGMATGARSLGPLALLASRGLLREGLHHAPGGWPGWVRAPWMPKLLGIAAAGEVVADKVAPLPPRTDAGPLVGRAVIGGLIGVLAARSRGERPLVPGVVGAGAAIAGAHLFTRSRASLTRSGVPDASVAVVEDVVVALLTGAADGLIG